MFKPTSRQTGLFPVIGVVTAVSQARLDASWAGRFLREIFPILLSVEETFADLYHRLGRPNFSTARLLGIVLLQQMFDLTDEAAVEGFSFDLRWQHALGVDTPDASLSRRSLVAFRSRLVRKDPTMTRWRAVFDRLCSAGLDKLQIRTDDQRIDSTQTTSNIRTRGRIDLFGRTLYAFARRLHRHHPEDFLRLPESVRTWFAQPDNGWFGRGGSAQNRVDLQTLARWIYQATQEFATHEAIASSLGYRLLVRLLHEHCEVVVVPPPEHAPAPTDEAVEESPDDAETPQGTVILRVLPKPAHPSTSLQSPFDPDAGFGHKGSGYTAQITETCNNDPDSPEWITDFDVAPAGAGDHGEAEASVERLEAQGRKPRRVFTDNGYVSGKTLVVLLAFGVQLLAPLHRGALAADTTLLRDQFQGDADTGQIRACPAGHAPVRHGLRQSSDGSGIATSHAFFDKATCQACPWLKACAVRAPNSGKNGAMHLEETPELWARDQALARQKDPSFWKEYAIRGGIEATNSTLKRRLGFGRLPVRGLPRVRLAVTAKLTALNVLRWLAAPG